MKEIIGINHIDIRVSERHSAKIFYERLGFKFIIGPIEPEPVAILEHPSGVYINLVLNADTNIDKNILMDVEENYPEYTHIALNVNNNKAVQSTIENLNIQITEGPITLPDAGQMFFIRNQDLNVIEFHQND